MDTLQNFGFDFHHVPLLCDSTSAISVVNNPVLHSRTKHIDVCFNFFVVILRKVTSICATLIPIDSWLTFSPNLLISLLLHICEGNWVFASLFDRGPFGFYFSSAFHVDFSLPFLSRAPFGFYFSLLFFHVDFSLSFLIPILYLHLM
jgi:hypothetical protein